ncbi:MAG: uroporphyrinogen-III synthase [Gammaproteobacteria bacterium]
MKAQSAPPNSGESLALKGCNVLLTRPALQATGVAQMIEAEGGHVVHLPLLEINAISERSDIEKVKSCVLALDQYDLAIFISTNAAKMGMAWISQYWPQLPVGLEAFAVGPSTAEMLRDESWLVHCSPQGVTSEDLLALPELVDVDNKRIALFRGKGGRELIAKTLRDRGARVDYIEVYERRVPEYDREQVLAQIHNGKVNFAIFTSMQTLLGFMQLLGLKGDDQSVPEKTVHFLQESLQLLVPSQRVLEYAVAAGFKCVIDAGGASDDQVLKSLRASQKLLEGM